MNQKEEYSFESDQPKLSIWQAMSHEVASCEPVAFDKGCTQMARTHEVTCMLRHISHFEKRRGGYAREAGLRPTTMITGCVMLADDTSAESTDTGVKS